MASANELSKKQQRKASKKERDAESLALMEVRRREQRRRRIQRRIGGVVVTLIVLAAVAAGSTWLVTTRIAEANRGPANMESDGVLISGDGTNLVVAKSAALADGAEPVPTEDDQNAETIDITVYADLGDDGSRTFLSSQIAQLQTYVTGGYVRLEVHPLATSGAEGERYANALACVAETQPDSFLTVLGTLTEADAGLTSGGIVSTLSDAGMDTSTVEDCITGDRFGHWVAASTARAMTGIPGADVDAVTTTPLVLVAGRSYSGDLDDTDAFTTFLGEVYTGEPAAGDGEAESE